MAIPISAATEQIRPDLLTRIATYAQRNGKTINELLQQMLDERETSPLPKDASAAVSAIAPEEWSRALRAWAASHPVSQGIVDDSRESIYEGRGKTRADTRLVAAMMVYGLTQLLYSQPDWKVRDYRINGP
jgi:hypothetical protein